MRPATGWRNETARDVAHHTWHNDEHRAATNTMTELQRAHPRHTAAGMRMDEREDITWEDV